MSVAKALTCGTNLWSKAHLLFLFLILLLVALEDEIKSNGQKEASVRLGHKTLRTLMKWSSLWYLPCSCGRGKPLTTWPLTRLWDEPTWRCHQNPFIGALPAVGSSCQKVSQKKQTWALKDGSQLPLHYWFRVSVPGVQTLTKQRLCWKFLDLRFVDGYWFASPRSTFHEPAATSILLAKINDQGHVSQTITR